MLSPLFSRTGVFRLEPIIHSKVKELLHRIDQMTGKKVVNLYDAFRHVTADIIMEFGFGRSPSIPDQKGLGAKSWLIHALEGFGRNIWTMQERPIINRISGMIPLCIMQYFDNGFGPMARLMKYGETCLQEYEKGEYAKSHPIVFDSLPTLSYKLKVMEAVELLIAGSGTTASTLTSAMIHILKNKDIHARLVSALQKVQPNEEGNLALSDLERVDYLVACAKESLRFGLAVPGRLPRVVPDGLEQPFVVDGKVVPPGTIVSISAYTMHYSEELWGADARTFNPDRWLDSRSKNLEQYLCTFSKGARMCLGHKYVYSPSRGIGFLRRSF
ncbi:cytochrome P450 [Aspergillus fischeri NRRL 181]|uniref:Cytochrome P450 oxidoreductase, putative n=1 Tax=Neosartorya fischeri (strain ATCC 1020 / DSM 3700 / CBS 544.65 / FGSC A1164 / JCM 1740 / NRRL 181 / WB 181) TaxID=331117 RepID=A1DNT0_NEOFI|nr:Cytochrome P450 oxidoreductase, putative [Aspergillus fischeri NRRL 181]EAW16451.1 Cytochrome P450 oxidoreductase, putative [Aspergillus fischeri NRRL 181]